MEMFLHEAHCLYPHLRCLESATHLISTFLSASLTFFASDFMSLEVDARTRVSLSEFSILLKHSYSAAFGCRWSRLSSLALQQDWAKCTEKKTKKTVHAPATNFSRSSRKYLDSWTETAVTICSWSGCVKVPPPGGRLTQETCEKRKKKKQHPDWTACM